VHAPLRRHSGIDGAGREPWRDFAGLLGRFYLIASEAIISENGIVDQFVGDEAVALFIPALAGEHHAAPAVRVARQLLMETGYDNPEGPWLRIGAGIHSGPAFVGAVAVAGEVMNFTALGDTVNATARLASAAASGEVLISDSALALADIDLVAPSDASSSSAAGKRQSACASRQSRP
jgi:adenylate cyclase